MSFRWGVLIVATAFSALGTAQAQTGQPIYVLSQDSSGASSIQVISPTAAVPYSVSKLRSIDGSPDQIRTVASGTTAFVRDQNANTVTAVSLIDTTAAPQAVTGLGTPEGYAVSGTTDTLYIANDATNTVSTAMTRGPSLNTVYSTVSGFSGPRDLLALTEFTQTGPLDRLYVANFTANTVSVVTGSSNVATNISTTIPVDVGPTRLAYSDSAVFVANSGSNDISVIDPESLTVTNTITGITNPTAMFLAPEGATLYVVAAGDNQLDVIPLQGVAAYTIAVQIPIGRGATDGQITTDGTEAYVLNTTDNTVSVISLATNSVSRIITGLGTVKSLALGAAPTSIVGAVLPGSRSVQQGDIATVFATMINAGDQFATQCRINLPTEQSTPLTITATTTDPSTNEVIGNPNEPVTLIPGVPQTYLLSFQASAVTALTEQPLQFFCKGIAPATSIPGVNTVDLTFSSAPTADVIALAATFSNDGVIRIPLSSTGIGAFAVASANVGAADTLTVSADFGGTALPISVGICQTDPTTGQCLTQPAASIPVMIASNATPTFSIFATADGTVASLPATNRIYVRFLDSQGVSHGTTSVAVETN